MGKRTVVTCDKCGKEWDDGDKGEQAVSILLKVDFGKLYPPTTDHFSGNRLYSGIWCRECIMKHGVYKPTTDADKSVAPDPAPSIEDVIVGVLNDLGFYQAE